MARLGLAVGGAIVGRFFGPIGARAGFVLGQLAGRALGIGVEKDRRDGSAEAAEFRVTNSAYGAPIASVDGAFRVGGSPIWIGEIIAVETEESAGKGLGGPTVTRTEYFATWAVALADARDLLPGGYGEVLKIFVGPDQELVLDKTADASPSQSDRYRKAVAGGGGLRIYTGEESQAPDPAIQAFEGVDNTPAYRGTCYLVFERFPVRAPSIEPVSAVVTMGATQKRPFERLDPHLGTTWTYWPMGDGRRISGGATIVDLISRQKSADVTFSVSGLGLVTLDAFNQWWGFTEFSDDVRLRLFDAESGAQLAVAAELWTNAVTVTVILPLSASHAVAFGSFGRMAEVAHVDADLEIVRKHNGTDPLALDSGVATWAIQGAQGWTKDGDGNFWITHDASEGGFLIEIAGGNGDPLNYYNIAGDPGGVTYEPISDALIVIDFSVGLLKFDLETRTLVDTLAFTLPSGSRNAAAFRTQPVDGIMYLQQFLTGNGSKVDVAATPMQILEAYQPNDWLGTANNWEGPVYDPVNHALIVRQTSGDAGAQDWAWLFLDRFDPAPPTLQSVVERRGAEVELDPSDDLDAGNLTDLFPGGIRPQREAIRPYLESTQPFYFYDAVEEGRADGYKVRFPKRGSAPVADIPVADLEAAPVGQAVAAQPRLGRVDPRTLPRLLEARYADPATDYQPGIQTDQREIEVVPGNEERLLEASHLAIDADRAAQAVEVNLFLAHLNATPVYFTTTRQYEKISAGDVVRILGAATWTVLIRQTRTTADNVKIFEGVLDDVTVYSSSKTGAPAEGVPAREVSILAPTSFSVLDIPLLPGESDDLRLFFAGGPSSSSGDWPGAAILRSTDGIDFAPYSVLSSAAALGFATEALADADPSVLDRTNILKVRLLSGAASSITEAQLIADLTLNGFALKNGAAWELGSFVDAQQQADGTWHLSTLVRGSFNTENYTAGHQAGDAILLLTAPALAARKTIDGGELGQTRYYKAVTSGGLPRDAVTRLHVAVGRSKLPYSPHLLGWSEAAGDYTIDARRRGRIFNLPVTFGAVPLGETVEDFEADLLDDLGAVALTITQTPSANGSKITISGDDFATLVKAADLAGITIPFTIKLYQIGGVDGATRGEPTTVIVG